MFAIASRPLHLALAALLALNACSRAQGASKLVYEGDSKFNHIVVTEDAAGVRALLFERDGAIQSEIRPGRPLDLRLPYTRSAMLGAALAGEPKRALIIGLGGGAMPMFLRRVYPDASIDVVELDPKVVEVAKKYFGLAEDEKLRIHVGDGRKFIERSSATWDLIFLDAYGASDIPRALATVEFLRQVRARLSPGGAIVGNVWARQSNALYGSMAATYAEAFGELCVVEVAGTTSRIFLVQPNKPVALDALKTAAAGLTKSRELPFDLAALVPERCLQDWGGERDPVLRDGT